MELVFGMLRIVVICVVVVVVMETASRGYQLLFPKPAQEIQVAVAHHITADGVDGEVDITTEVISVVMGVEEATRKMLDK